MHDSDPTPRQDPEDRDRPGGPEGPDKQTGAGRADGGGPQPDIDAEFAARVRPAGPSRTALSIAPGI